MAHLMPMELWAMTFSNLDYKDLRKCMLVNNFFHGLTQHPKLRSTLFRGVVVSTLTSYYRFLVSMYLPESAIEYPPEGGWPHITKDCWPRRKYWNKTNDVIELARQLPRAQGRDESGEQHHIYCAMMCSSDSGYCPTLPASTLYLATPYEGHGYHLFLEVEQEIVTIDGTDDPFLVSPGAVYKPYSTTEAGAKLSRIEYVEGEIQQWREGQTYRFPDLFEEFKRQFRELIVHPYGTGMQVFGSSDFHQAERAIFDKHGWPTSTYDKDACMAELKAYAAAQQA